MGCFSCFVSRKKDVEVEDSDHALPNNLDSENDRNDTNFGDSRAFDQAAGEKSPVKSFTYRELCTATGMFNDANWIGEGGFGKVFKGRLETGEVVAVKQLNHEGVQGSHEFIIEVLMLSHLHHPNFMNLKGYCIDGDEKLLVYEYMPKGSLERHLFDLTPDKVPLDWNTRLKIAVGTARGLWYLHDTANPPVIFRDLKPANILLDNEFNARLSDFGLAKLGPVGDHTHVSTRVMGTYGYCAPEYAMSGKLTVKCDVYSFGVLLLELITGRKAFDSNMTSGERTLVDWSRPFLKDRRKFVQLADPAMKGRYPMRCLHHAIAIAAMCIQDQPAFRPLIVDVLVALEFLASQPYHSEPGVFRHKSHFQPSPSHRDLSRF